MRPHLLTVATLLLAATHAFAQAPQIGTVTPAQVNVNPGVSQTLTFTASYAVGGQPELLVSITNSSAPYGCYFMMQWNSGNPLLFLYDGNTGSSIGYTYFGSGTVSSSFCQIAGQSAALDPYGNLTFSIGTTFPSSTAGQTFDYYEEAISMGSLSGWWQMPGDYVTVAAPARGPPQLGTVTPANGTTPANQPTTLQVTAIDPNGWSYANVVQVLITPNGGQTNACLVVIVPAQGAMFLYSDDMSTFNPVWPAVNAMNWPASGVASNSQCTLTGQGSSLSYDGTTFATSRTLTMTLNLQFTGLSAGLNTIQEWVLDTQFGIAGWGAIGTVTVGAPPIFISTCMDIPFGITGNNYSIQLAAQGPSPYTWSIQPAPPPGMTFSGGTLGGAPTQAGNYALTFGVSNASGAATPLSCNLSIITPSQMTTQNGSLPDPYMPATQVGVFRPNTAFLEDSNGNGAYDPGLDRFIVNFAGQGGFRAGDMPVAGDWTGDGTTKVGIYRQSTGTWFLDANNNGVFDAGDLQYQFGGIAGDIPFAGDWNGLGKDCIGIYRPPPGGSVWLLDMNCNGSFDGNPVDAFFAFGGVDGDVPVVGKWTGAKTRVGVVRAYAPGGVRGPCVPTNFVGCPFYWALDGADPNAGNDSLKHQPQFTFAFGGIYGDKFVTGDWYNNGTSSAGVFRTLDYTYNPPQPAGLWVLDPALPAQAQADHSNPNGRVTFGYGGVAEDVPVTGHWAPVTPPTPLTLPLTGLKGVEYFPRGHAWWNMLYDWYTSDCSTTTLTQDECTPNTSVSQLVKGDLATLATNGFNFVHLYVWDQDQVNLFSTTPAPPPGTLLPLVPQGSSLPGFASLENGGPQSSGGLASNGQWVSGAQWNALKEFVAAAAAQHLYVVINFATLWPKITYNLPGASAAAVGNSYATWVGQFVSQVPVDNKTNTSCPTPGCYNVPIWGISYGIDLPATSNPTDAVGQFWHAAYRGTLGQVSQNVYPPGNWFRSGRALLGVDPILQGPSGTGTAPVLAQLGGTVTQAPYQWYWQGVQSVFYNLRTQVGAALGDAPDVYLLELWNPNATDLARSLQCLAGQSDAGQSNSICATTPAQSCNGPCDKVPFQKILVTEMGDSTSFEAFPFGNGAVSFGDGQEPTTNNAGQKQWLTDTLCMFSNLGIYNFAWFGLYDALSWYEKYTSNTPAGFAWGGFWGLRPEVSGYGDKPAWSAMVGFNPTNPAGCSTPAPPSLALQADATYYTVGDTAQLTYTASNATSLSIAPPAQLVTTPTYASFDCEKGVPLVPSPPAPVLVGSCAYTNAQLTATTNSVTLNGHNQPASGGLSSASTSVSVTVGASPIINGLVNYTTGPSCDYTANPSCLLTVGQTDTLEIFGKGFALDGGNKVKLTSGVNIWWLYSTDGAYFWDGNGQRVQVNAQLYCSITPGTWTIQMVNPNSTTPSPGYSINVVHSSGCP